MLRRRLATALALILTAAGCQMPRFQGPQIQSPPENFLINADNVPGSWMFPDREHTFNTAWVHTDISGTSLIRVVGHPGTSTPEDVMAARERVIASETDPDMIAEDIEVLTIDERRAWGWYQRVQSDRRGLVQVSYRAIVPYDTVTYVVEFVSGEPSLKAPAPDTLRAIVSSFAIGRTTLDFPKLAIFVGAVLLLVAFLRGRARDRKDQLRSINLVKIEKQDDDDADEDAPVAAAAGAGPTPRDPTSRPGEPPGT